jgi:membrane protease subunit HflK
MSWNEPGGNGKQRDPWGGGDGGPPDLDEAFRRFKDKLGGAFGGSGGGRSGDDGNPFSGPIFGLIALIVLAVWGYMGIHAINEQERAVVLRLGKFHSLLDPGLNWNPAMIDEVIPVNVTRERQYTARGLMLTQDEISLSCRLPCSTTLAM